MLGKENTSRTKRDIEYCCELKKEIKRYSKMVDPLGKLERLMQGFCDTSEIEVELPPERVEEIQIKLNSMRVEYEKLATDLKDAILMNISDEEQLKVLKLRYTEGLGWDDVINAMGYSSRTVYRYHSKALVVLDSIRYNI